MYVCMYVTQVQRVLQTRYLLQVGNDTGTRVYLFPQSVKHMHPEFDQAVVQINKFPIFCTLLFVNMSYTK